jgi:hypothetical protein
MKKSIVITSFKRITSIKNNGKKYVLLNAGTANETFIPAGQFNNANSANISDLSLEGCTVNLTYYKEGEELLNKDICSEGGKLIREVSITPSMDAKITDAIASQFAAKFGLGMPTAAASTPVSKKVVDEEEEPVDETTENENLTNL